MFLERINSFTSKHFSKLLGGKKNRKHPYLSLYNDYTTINQFMIVKNYFLLLKLVEKPLLYNYFMTKSIVFYSI